MPNESLNIYLSITDKGSLALTSLGDKTKALDKETQELAQSYDALQKANATLVKEKADLQKKLREVSAEVKNAKQNFMDLGDEVSRDAYEKALEKQENLRASLAATNASLKENQRMFKENMEAIRKGTVESSPSGIGSVVGAIAAQGIGSMAGDLAQNAMTTLAGSALGDEAGSIFGSALSSAVSGAAIGSMIAPGIGTAVGAALGGLVGAANGGLSAYEGRDDAFKEYYGGLYSQVQEGSGSLVESGSSIAGSREQTRMAFSQRLGGDDRADAYLARVEKMAALTNYDYDEIVGYAKLLLNSYEADEVLGVLQKLSDATAGLELNTSDVNMMISGLSRMRTTGKATQEYLNYFRERGVDVDEALANSLHVDKSSITDMISKQQISGEYAAEAILDFIETQFGGLSEGLASTYDAMKDNLGDIMTTIQASGGEGYNTLRKEGLNAQMEAYEGDLGDAMKEINAIIGENLARKENLEDQYMRETLSAVLLGEQGTLFTPEQQATLSAMAEEYAALSKEYAQGNEEAGAKMESLYEQAQALGQAYFENSDEVKRLNEIEKDEIAAIRENTAGLGTATQAAYQLQQALSKGYASAPSWATFLAGGNALSWVEKLGWVDTDEDSHPHAFGLERVPYDDYPALLHEGERVLTASQARALDRESETQQTTLARQPEPDFPTLARDPYRRDEEVSSLAGSGKRRYFESSAFGGDEEVSSLASAGKHRYFESSAFGEDEEVSSLAGSGKRRYFESSAFGGDEEENTLAKSFRRGDAERKDLEDLLLLLNPSFPEAAPQRGGENIAPHTAASGGSVQGGVTVNVNVTGNTIAGAGEELADQLAEIIVRKLEQAATAAAPK